MDEARASLGLAPLPQASGQIAQALTPPAGKIAKHDALKYNHYHDSEGRFTTSGNATSASLHDGVRQHYSLSQPSQVSGAGTQVAGDNTAPDDGKVDESYGIDAAIGIAGALLGPGAIASLVSNNVSPTTSTGENTLNSEEGAENYDWSLGDFKSEQTWQNQMNDRQWTLQDIDDTIQNGEQVPAPNDVNPGNPAIRYVNPQTGKYVVKDQVTQQILQISREGFIPKTFP